MIVGNKLSNWLTKNVDKVLNKKFEAFLTKHERIRKQATAEILEAALKKTDETQSITSQPEVDWKPSASNYVLGYVEPQSSFYSALLPVDTRVFFTDEPWIIARPKALAENGVLPKSYNACQAISWDIYKGGMLRPTFLPYNHDVVGTMVDILMDYVKCPPEGKYITVVTLNEYGRGGVIFEGKDFRIHKIASGMSIDDIVSEQLITFSCKYMGAYSLSTNDDHENDEYAMDRVSGFNDDVDELEDDE